VADTIWKIILLIDGLDDLVMTRLHCWLVNVGLRI